jgi:3-dehydroquinate dehydratase/shikimate dehydrogenase
MTYLAVPISAQSMDRAGRQIVDAVSAGAEMLELRTDYLDPLDKDSVTALIAAAKGSIPASMPVIVTCRDPGEGGVGNHPEALRIEILLAAVEAGADFIDLEYANFLQPQIGQKIRSALAGRPKSRLILSAHDFQGKFADLRRLCREVHQAFPAAVTKLVYTAHHINECFDAFDLLHENSVAPPPSGVKDPSRGRLGYIAVADLIVLCMGQAGLISRVLARKLGGFVTFASLDEQAATAPGQLTVGTLKGLYRYDRINAETELFGVIADPVGHSLSPAIHNACFADQGMDRLYLPLLVQGGQAEFDQFLDHVLARPWLDFRGFSVTIPHKHSALKYVHAQGGFVEPLADKIGAANTLIVGPSWRGRPALASRGHPFGGLRAGSGLARPDGDTTTESGVQGQDALATKEQGQDAIATVAAPDELAAYNTDYAGALDAITAGMGIERKDLRNVPVAVVGAGGVSRAIVAGLTDVGASVTIYNRTVERAKELATEFSCQFAALDGLSAMNAKLLINCTSIGMHPNVEATPIPVEYLKPDMVVFDTVYNPAETSLLKQAKQNGAKTIDGVAMFVNQAAAQFRLFTGCEGDARLMRKTVIAELAVYAHGGNQASNVGRQNRLGQRRMGAEESDAILLKEDFEQRRTLQELNEWVEGVHSRLRAMGKIERYRLLESGIGKKFIDEMHPLNLFAQSYFRGRADISLEGKLGGQSFDAQVFEGGRELCRIEITEAIDGRKWALQKELLLEDGWAPDTGPIECATKKHNRKKGDIKATLEAVSEAQIVQEGLGLIEEALNNKFKKSNRPNGSYGCGAWLLVAFNDTTVFHPDQLGSDDKNKLCDAVQRKIHSLCPRFDKVFLVGWSGRSLYEFDVGNRRT